jgi:hypothetical protein
MRKLRKTTHQKKFLGKISLLTALCLLLFSCGSKPEPLPVSEPEPDFFHTVVSIDGGKFAPKAVPFLTSKQGVMDVFLHDRSTVLFPGRSDDRIMRDIVIDGLTWREIFTFHEDLLIAVVYVTRSETKEEFEEISQRLAKEAEAFMPKELLMNANGIQAGKGQRTYWRDELGGRVTFGFSNTVTREEQPGISLEIWQESEAG